MGGLRPGQVQQIRQGQRRPFAVVELLEQLGYLAHQAGHLRRLAVVVLREEVVSQQRRVHYRLHHTVHKARVAQIDQAPQSDGGLRRHTHLLRLVGQQAALLLTGVPRDALKQALVELPGLHPVLQSDPIQIRVVNVIAATGAMHLAIVQFDRKSVSCVGIVVANMPVAAEKHTFQAGVQVGPPIPARVAKRVTELHLS